MKKHSLHSPRSPLARSHRCICALAVAIAVVALGMVSHLDAAEAVAPPQKPEAPPADPQLVERWDAIYRDRRAPWDTGRPSTELKRMVEQKVLRPGRAVELGCGTGVNAVYLATQGFDVTAIDLSPTALEAAEERARKAGVKVRWIQADVTNPPSLEPFDLIFDRGCYHGVRRQNAAGYVKTVEKLCRPGGRMLILAGNANEPAPAYGPPRVDETELVAEFGPGFDFESLREIRFDTADPNAQGAWAWSILLRRKAP
jgi:SAM-dependent methyltransferase